MTKRVKKMRELTLKEASLSLKSACNTLIFCHRNPDPDTLGSAYALKCILEHLGSSVRVACCDAPNPKFSFITGGEDLTADFDISDFERVVAIDVGSPSQLGEYSYYQNYVTLNIDHHEMSWRFCDYYESFTPACAMIVYDIAKELQIVDKLPLRFFECVYAGLSGDTGCFKYSNTTPESLVYASEIIATGIDFAKINYTIFDCKSKGELSAQKMALEHTQLFENGKLAILLVTNQMKSEYDVTDSDIGDIISTVRTLNGVLVAISIKETSTKGKFSVSTRSNCGINVAEVCARLGGGGHTRAAGVTLEDMTMAEAFELIKTSFSEVIYGYNE